MGEIEEAGRPLRRRGVVLGGLAAFAGALLGRASTARADHVDSMPIVGGETNVTEHPTTIDYRGEDKESAFRTVHGMPGQTEDFDIGLLGAGTEDIAGAVPLNGTTRAGVVAVGSKVAMAAVSPGTVAGLFVRGPVMDQPVDIEQNPAAIWSRDDMGTGVVGISNNNIGIAAVSGGPWIAPNVPPVALWARGFGQEASGIVASSDNQSGVVGKALAGRGYVGIRDPDAKAGVFGLGGGNTPGTWGFSEDGQGAWGLSQTGFGVQGVSRNKIGGWFYTSEDDLDGSGLEPAALHATGVGNVPAVCATAENAPAAMFEAAMATAVMAHTGSLEHPPGLQKRAAVMGVADEQATGGVFMNMGGGLALNVIGRAAYPIVQATIPIGVTSFDLEASMVQEDTLVLVQPKAPIPEYFVRNMPGMGFRFVFKEKTKSPVPLNALILSGNGAQP